MRHDETAPLEPGREYDKPAGPHVGHGAALRVPVSSGEASFVLDRPEAPTEWMMAEEPDVEPARAMEAGTDQEHRSAALDALNVPFRFA